MRIKLLFTALLIVFAHMSTAQVGLDSLYQLANTEKDPCLKVEKIERISRALMNTDLNKALYWADQGFSIARKNNCPKGIATMWNLKAIVAISQGKSVDAFVYIDSAIVQFKSLGDEAGLSSAVGNKGTLFFYIGKYEESLEHHLSSLAIDERIKDSTGIATTLANIYGIYHIQKDYKKAVNTGLRALKAFQKLHQKDGEALMLANLGSVYTEMKSFDSAVYYVSKAEKLFIELKQIEGIADCKRLTSEILRSKKNYDLALQQLQEALATYEQIGNEHKQSLIYEHLAPLYLDMGNNRLAIEASQKLFEFSKTQGSKQFERDAYKWQMIAYRNLEDYKKALEFSDLYHQLEDELLGLETTEQLNKLKSQYELQRKEKQLNEYKKESEILKLNNERQAIYLITLILFILLLVGAGFFIMRNRKLRAQANTIQLEQRLLRSQMNPHFIFNSLTAIQSFFYKNEPKEAGKFLSAFAQLIRIILDNSRTEYILLSKEIEWLENYLKLQLLRFDNRFAYTIHYSENIAIDFIQIPPMLIQPFIENALEHGFSDIDYVGELNVYFSLEREELRVIIEDNGVGLQHSQENSSQKHVSVATAITKERLYYLNRNQSKSIEFEIKSRPNGGTIVDFKIPTR